MKKKAIPAPPVLNVVESAPEEEVPLAGRSVVRKVTQVLPAHLVVEPALQREVRLVGTNAPAKAIQVRLVLLAAELIRRV